ncbi:MAG TPA: Crp/Fnr family transcriptional regulator [Rhizomicrobium sp.]|nr:Crp/Fnr family transcriptional regulator [Rhizomicrobium sp.]
MNRYRPERLDARVYRDFAVKSLSRLGPLSEEDVTSLFQALNVIETWPQGQELIGEGAAQGQPRILLEGWALRQRDLAGGRRQIFGFILPGDVFGLSARPDRIVMCSIVAATAATSCQLPFLGRAMREETGALHELVWHMIAREEACLLDQVVRLGRQSAHERMLHLLLELHARLKEVGKTDGAGFHLPLSQEVLSDALGLSVVHTNRTLQQLRREHLIQTHGSHLILSDPERMAEIARYRPSRFEPPQPAAQASVNVPSCSSTDTVTSNPSA